MGQFLKKRGGMALSRRADINHKIIMALATMLLFAMVLFAFFERINNLADDTTFTQYYVAFDTGLLMTTLYASPTNLLYHYTPIKTDIPLLVTLTDSKVSVSVDGQQTAIAYYYMEDRYTSPLRGVIPATEISPLIKAGQVMTRNINEVNLAHIVCPRIFQNDPAWKTNAPLSVWFESLDTLDILPEDTSIVQEREAFFGDVNTQLKNNHLLDTSEKDGHIDIRLIKKFARGSKITAYIPLRSEKLLESRTLACHILNELIVPGSQVKALIVPVNTEHRGDDDPLKDLPEDKISVALELGEFSPTLSSAEGVSDAIYNGLQRFYGQETEPTPATLVFGASETSGEQEVLAGQETILTEGDEEDG